MTQRVFDVENEKDMQDLWNILPDMVKRIEKDDVESLEIMIPYNRYMGSDYCIGGCPYIAINWHDKTEIKRPIQEVTKQDKGKLCAFWNENEEEYRIAIFTHTLDKFNNGYNFCDNTDTYWKHCRRLTKQEIEELC